jgi:hypothetical protein
MTLEDPDLEQLWASLVTILLWSQLAEAPEILHA